MRRVLLLLLVVVVACGGAPPPPVGTHEQPPAPALPQPHCVADPESDAFDRVRAAGEEASDVDAHTVTIDDLDADTTPDVVVEWDCGAEGSCRRAIYFSAHGCTRYAGGMRALRMEATGGWHRGVRDLETFDSKGCAGLAGGLTNWIWDGQSYVDTTTLECACPDGTNAATRAPRCPRAPIQ